MTPKTPFAPLTKESKRRQYLLYGLGALAAIMVLGGLFITGSWVSAGGLGAIPFLASDTPTPSDTPLPTNTPTITLTPSETVPPTLPPSPTASAPFLYRVETGDTLSGIADKFAVDFIIIMALNGLSNDSVLFVGQELIIPDPNTGLPDPTPIPEGLPAGTEILYLVLPGDSLGTIAEQFLSTEDAIIAANDLLNPNEIFVGQLLAVPIRLITPTPGPSPTPAGSVAPTASTPTATATP